jgi:hypothetical protein
MEQLVGGRIKYNMVWAMIKSAVLVYYAIYLHKEVLRDIQRWGRVIEGVSHMNEMGTMFCAKGMAHRMGTETIKQSRALSHVHLAYLDDQLKLAYRLTASDKDSHELVCAGRVNLMAYKRWLRSGELFVGQLTDLMLTRPVDGPT